ncbi:MAG: hypothetical protein MI799_12590, partial [Desulfobacterales bacterium]|nr:hypothetical protein [Desulfobacterales bacterium]
MTHNIPGGNRMEVRFDIRQEKDIIVAAEAVREHAEAAGFSTVKQYTLATAVSELATNIFFYADHGSIRMKMLETGNRRGIEICAKDNGPGIVDLDLAL